MTIKARRAHAIAHPNRRNHIFKIIYYKNFMQNDMNSTFDLSHEDDQPLPLFCTRTDRCLDDFTPNCLELLKERVFENTCRSQSIELETISWEKAEEVYFSIGQDLIGIAIDFNLLYMEEPPTSCLRTKGL